MDAQVVEAFSLGWHIAELYQYQRLPGEPEPDRQESLPGIGRLTREERAQLLLVQINASLVQLKPEDVASTAVGQQLQADRVNVDTLKQVTRDLHLHLLKTLTAARLGKAYSLGRELAETMLLPVTDKPQSFVHQFEVHRVRALHIALSDLKGSFPRYAADMVQRTLDAWTNWVLSIRNGAPKTQWTPEQKRHVGQSLRHQGMIWYGLLTGEIDPLQLLRANDYIVAAESLLSRIGRLVWTFFIATWSGRLLGLMAIGGAILLVIVSLLGHLASIVGVGVLFLGAAGITVGSVASSVGQVLRQVQGPLWDAELLNAAAVAAASVPNLSAAAVD